ncbi:MAG TPA: dispase autolysis-inducing protein [Thermoanaerobaculia bacterium]
MITGTGAVSFTHDRGETLAPSAVPLRPISYTYGLTSLIDAPETLAAWSGNDLLLSTDGGCSWRVEATVTGADFPPRLTPARGGRLYAWSDNRNFLVRWDARGASRLKPPADVVGLGVDAANADHLRIGGSDGTLWESTDGGESWSQLNGLRSAAIYYRFTFDPQNLDHIVAGVTTSGAYVTRDAGRNWTRATGIASRDANVFELVFAPSNPERVWIMGIDLAESDANVPSHGRHIYQSDDGGATYAIVVDEAPGVKLVNQPIMAADPWNPDVLYFVFGTYFQGYGTDLFRYDAARDELTMTHNEHDDVNAIAFSRTDRTLLYLGFEEVQ